jgi:hypothetical protein
MTDARRVLAEKRRLILPIVIALVVNIALFAIVVYPLSKKVAGGEQQSKAATSALNAAKRDYDAARATVTGKRRTTGDVSSDRAACAEVQSATRARDIRSESAAGQSAGEVHVSRVTNG